MMQGKYDKNGPKICDSMTECVIYLYILRPYGRAADPVAILDTITELKSMAPGQDVRSEEKRSEEKKRKEKTRYWLHAHGAGNFTQLL